MNIDDLIIKYGLTFNRRFSKNEKYNFCNELGKDFENIGFSVKGVIGKNNGTKGLNLIVGNLNSAKTIFIAHYDTMIHNFGNPINYYPLNGSASFSSSFLPMNTPIILAMIFGFVLYLYLGDMFNLKTNTIFSIAILVFFSIILIVTYFLTFKIGNKINLNKNTSSIIALYLLAQSLSETQKKETAFVFTDGGCGTHIGDYILRKEIPDFIDQKNIIILDCIGNGSTWGIGYRENSKTSAKKIEALFKKYINNCATLLTSLNDLELKYSSASFYKNVTVICSGENVNNSIIVKNIASKKDCDILNQNIINVANVLADFVKNDF